MLGKKNRQQNEGHECLKKLFNKNYIEGIRKFNLDFELICHKIFEISTIAPFTS